MSISENYKRTMSTNLSRYITGVTERLKYLVASQPLQYLFFNGLLSITPQIRWRLGRIFKII
jgi:hypothetical protein